MQSPPREPGFGVGVGMTLTGIGILGLTWQTVSSTTGGRPPFAGWFYALSLALIVGGVSVALWFCLVPPKDQRPTFKDLDLLGLGVQGAALVTFTDLVPDDEREDRYKKWIAAFDAAVGNEPKLRHRLMFRFGSTRKQAERRLAWVHEQCGPQPEPPHVPPSIQPALSSSPAELRKAFDQLPKSVQEEAQRLADQSYRSRAQRDFDEHQRKIRRALEDE